MSIFRVLKPIVEKIPGAAGYYRYMRDSKALKNEVHYRENLGFFFNGNSSMEKGEFEPHETAIIESLLSSFDTFVNIGANTGYYVCKALNSGIPTIAFEPNQLNVNILLRNIEANAFPTTFQLFPVALSNHLGILPMYGASTGASLVKGWAGQENSYLVPISTFDMTAKPLVDGKSCLFLMDIEGAELGCLKGSSEILASSNNNAFLIEISVAEHQPTGTEINPHLLETFSLMASYGFEAYTADTSLRKIELAEVSEIESSHIDTIGTHNFLFLKGKDILSKIVFK
jgi:FkbM family methyltransferase|tara:strand:- start:17 stop:874 length:858 start_codon:yes stop_codon:yes gene_type:complete